LDYKQGRLRLQTCLADIVPDVGKIDIRDEVWEDVWPPEPSEHDRRLKLLMVLSSDYILGAQYDE